MTTTDERIIPRGTRVRFTHGPLGLLADPDGLRFAEPVARAGDMGAYFGEHPTLDDWHIVEVAVDGVALYAPVHRAQFQVSP